MAYQTNWARNSPHLKRIRYEEWKANKPEVFNGDSVEGEEGEGFSLDEYEIRWYCYRCNFNIAVYDANMLDLKGYRIVEDEDTGKPILLQTVAVQPPDNNKEVESKPTVTKKKVKKKKKSKGKGNASNNALDIHVNPLENTNTSYDIDTNDDDEDPNIEYDTNDNGNGIDDNAIGYCSHCHLYIRPEEKDKLTSRVIKTDTDEIADIRRLFIGWDEDNKHVLVANDLDVIPAFYENRLPKLTAHWAEWPFTQIIDYYPVSNITKKWDKDQITQAQSDDEDMEEYHTKTTVYNSTPYARQENKETTSYSVMYNQ